MHIFFLFFAYIPFVVNYAINATPPERLQHYQQSLYCCISGVRGGGASAPQNFQYVENPGKICVNLGKICENLWKIPENLGKNGAQRWQNHMKTSFWRSLQKKTCLRKCSQKKWPKIFLDKFGEILAKILCSPKNLPSPTRGVRTLFFLTPHPILFGKFWIRIQSDSATTMMKVIRLLFDSASIKVMHIPRIISTKWAPFYLLHCKHSSHNLLYA